jgi:Protein of unknown function (DUF2793)/Pectate lyase superfamily protein
MDSTPNLALPYIFAAQAQKHVTHNEAIRNLDALVQLSVLDRDLSMPPTAPDDGQRFIVGPTPSGVWSGQAGKIAAFQDFAWMFYSPRVGWVVWVADEAKLLAWDGSQWTASGGTNNPTPLLGVNATADATNRLSVSASASLFNHDGADHRLTLNKAMAAHTASILYQDGFSGRAELGLAGDDDFHVKVSPDGTTWREAIVINRSTGGVRFPNTLRGAILDVKGDYGAVGDGVVNDTVAIQAALDAVGTAGGGTVHMPAGVYKTTDVLLLPSNVHLSGAGQATIIRNPAGALPSKAVGGTTVNATIASVGTVGARVSRLTIDHATHGTHTNGIQFGEAGATSRTSDAVAEHCQLLGADAHQYLLYVKLADRCKILNNRVVGKAAGVPTADVAGVEIFGADSCEVAGNSIKNCAEGIIVKTELLVAQSYCRNIDVHDNVVESCLNGISVSGTAGTGNEMVNIDIHDNAVSGCTNRGVTIGISALGVAKNLSLNSNVVRECNGGCVIIDNDVTTVTEGLVLANNTISQSGGAATGIICKNAKNLVLFGNLVAGLPYYGIDVLGGADVSLFNNTVFGSQQEALHIAAFAAAIPIRVHVISNNFSGYGANAARPGCYVNAGNEIVFVGNFFRYGAASSGAYAIDAQTGTNCTISNNVLAWATQSAAFVNGVGGRNNYGNAIWDRNANRVSHMFPREVGFSLDNTAILTEAIDIGGNIRLRNPQTPASAVAAGNQGTVKWDSGFIYVCTAANTWKRAALAAW